MSLALDLQFIKANVFYYPTACKIPDHGLRVFFTIYLITRDGNVHNIHDQVSATEKKNLLKALKQFGIKDILHCRTIRLTSDIQGMTSKN